MELKLRLELKIKARWNSLKFLNCQCHNKVVKKSYETCSFLDVGVILMGTWVLAIHIDHRKWTAWVWFLSEVFSGGKLHEIIIFSSQNLSMRKRENFDKYSSSSLTGRVPWKNQVANVIPLDLGLAKSGIQPYLELDISHCRMWRKVWWFQFHPQCAIYFQDMISSTDLLF